MYDLGEAVLYRKWRGENRENHRTQGDSERVSTWKRLRRSFPEVARAVTENKAD
jgi:hypothetical protein